VLLRARMLAIERLETLGHGKIIDEIVGALN
jgi:hypothetical protein